MASHPGPEAEQLSPPSSSSGELQTAVEVETPAAERITPQHDGQQHTAIDVRPSPSNGHQQQQQGYTRNELKAEEKAGLLNGLPLSAIPLGGCTQPGPRHRPHAA